MKNGGKFDKIGQKMAENGWKIGAKIGHKWSQNRGEIRQKWDKMGQNRQKKPLKSGGNR